MPDPNLVNFINSARSQGQNDQSIKQQLLTSGWAEADINQALFPQPQAAPIAQTPQIQNPTPFAQPQPQTNFPNNFQTGQPNQKPTGGFPKIAIFIVVGLVVLGIIGAAVFFFLNSSKTPMKSDTGKSSSSDSKNTSGSKISVDSKYVFDIPALFNKDGQTIKDTLGKPKEESSYNGQISFIGYSKGNYDVGWFYVQDYQNNSDKLYFSNIAIQISKNLDKATILNDLHLTENDSKYDITIRAFKDDPSEIFSIYVYEKNSKYFDVKSYLGN